MNKTDKSPIITVAVILLIQIPVFFQCSFGQSDATGFAISIDEARMRGYLEVLTSDSLQGRETGHAGQRKAAGYIATNFFQFGLESASQDTFQYHAMSVRSNKGHNLTINKESFCFGKDFFYLGGQADTMIDSQKQVFVSSAIGAKKKSGRVAVGHTSVIAPETILIFSEGGPASALPLPTSCIRTLFIITDDFHHTFDSLSRAERRGEPLISSLTALPFRIVWISNDAAKACEKKAMQKALLRPRKKAHIAISASISLKMVANTSKMLGQNVPFILKGSTKPEEVVVVTAHYDHLGVKNDTIYRGADDDASGTTAVIEMARVFSNAAASGKRPYRSILFMPVSGEEKGLLGSAFYSQHPLLPLSNTVANVNIDMIGRIDPEHDSLKKPNYVYVIGSDKLSTELHTINEEANRLLPGLDLDYRYNVPGEPNRFYFRSDHYNFAKHRIPSIFYFNGKHADYHSHTDTPDKIDYATLRLRTQLAFLTAWELANRPLRISADKEVDMEK